MILAGYAIKALVVSKCHWCRHPAVLGASFVAGCLLWVDAYYRG